MPVFKIVPIDRDDPDWRCSRYCGEALVREATEERARALASRTFGLFDPIGEGSCLCPWSSEFHTRCILQDAIVDDREPKVLFPTKPLEHCLTAGSRGFG